MASRSLRMFVTPEEFHELLQTFCSALAMEVVLQRGQERWRCDGKSLGGARTAFLVPLGSRAAEPTPELDPAEVGWVSLDVPSVDDDMLFVVQLGVRSDWFDRETQLVHENPDAVRRFTKLRAVARKHLSFPTRVRGSGGGERIARDIGCSEGAIEWFRQGRRLGQRGVRDVWFEPALMMKDEK